MGRHDCDTASVPMLLKNAPQYRMPGRIKGCGWFVQQPERPVGDEHPGKRRATTLSCGTPASGEIRALRDPEAGQGIFDSRGIGAQDTGPRMKVLPERQGRFQAVKVPCICHDLCIDRQAVPDDPSALWNKDSGDGQQERGLAGSVRSPHMRDATRRQRKVDAGEQDLSGTSAGEV